MTNFRQVFVVGGTHGNELTAITLLKIFKEQPELLLRKGINCECVFANKEAYKLGRRYKDRDLNRCFTLKELNGKEDGSYELKRAKELNQLMGPKGGQVKADMILDMHTSTANMGLCIILHKRTLPSFTMAAYMASRIPEAKVYYSKALQDDPHLPSIAENCLTLEIGPVAQNLIQHRALRLTSEAVKTALDFMELCNNHCPPTVSLKSTEAYEYMSYIDYPRNAEGQVDASIHESLQNRDFEILQKGDVIFQRFSGEIVRYNEDNPCWPVFINEAAYYEKGVAFETTTKSNLQAIWDETGE